VRTSEAIRSDQLPPPVGPFSPAIRAGGFIFFSGQVGVEPATGKLVAGGIEAEARQLFANLAVLLEAAGKAFGDVVRAGVFLTEIGDFGAVNGIYAERFEPPFPARTTVAVAALPLGASVEIELIVQA
jgi:2-iminobutanoate/2-iminopropanoate deaminase